MYWLLVFVATCIGWVPEKILSGSAKIIGLIAFDVFRIRRTLMINNIRSAFPQISTAQAVQMARASVVHLATTILEIFWIWSHDMENRVAVENFDGLTKALESGRGAYVLCTHTGNFEAFAMIVSRKFAMVTSPVKRVGRSEGVNKFIRENRAKQGMDAFVRQKKGDGFKAIQKALRENRIVGFMMDQARPGEPKLSFFGKPAKTNTSLGAIWEKSPAPVIPGYCRRVGFARHVVSFLPELTFNSTGDLQADILNRAQTCNTIVEEIVRKCPDQYWWVHDRWK